MAGEVKELQDDLDRYIDEVEREIAKRCGIPLEVLRGKPTNVPPEIGHDQQGRPVCR